jgi:hypothetical protein
MMKFVIVFYYYTKKIFVLLQQLQHKTTTSKQVTSQRARLDETGSSTNQKMIVLFESIFRVLWPICLTIQVSLQNRYENSDNYQYRYD